MDYLGATSKGRVTDDMPERQELEPHSDDRSSIRDNESVTP